MQKTFQFNLDQLSIEEQKHLYNHFDAECDYPEKFDKAINLEELKACFDENNNTEVYRLAFMAAMLAHEIAYMTNTPVERDGEEYTFVDVKLQNNVDLGEDFDIGWYDGLNSEGYGVISLVNTIESYGLEEVKTIFKKYDFLKVKN